MKQWVIGLAMMAASAGAQGPGWNPEPWLGDLAAMRQALDTKYANLDWLRDERGVDLDALVARTEQAVRQAGDDAGARRAFDRFVQRIGDGHVDLSWPAGGAAAGAVATPVTYRSASELCAGLGYRRRAKPGVAAALPGRVPLAQPGPFEAATVKVGDAAVGIVRIPEFSPQAFPDQCVAAVAAVPEVLGKPCDDACADAVLTEAFRAMTRELMASYDRLRAAGATVVLVDLTDNGGGSDWAEAAARTLSRRPLRSAVTGFVRGPHWAGYWRDLAAQLRVFAAKERGADRRRLLAWAADAEAARVEAAPTPGPGVPRIARAGFATGLVGDAAAGSLPDKPWATAVFNPAQYAYPYRDGAWDGPVIVLVNQETWSAAEEVAAVLRDNDAAVVLGERTGGAGCGHTRGGTPTVLPHSKAVLALPDCVRFRADGSNEVNGVVPDVLTGMRANDGPAFAARLVAARLGEAVMAARAMWTGAR